MSQQELERIRNVVVDKFTQAMHGTLEDPLFIHMQQVYQEMMQQQLDQMHHLVQTEHSSEASNTWEDSTPSVLEPGRKDINSSSIWASILKTSDGGGLPHSSSVTNHTARGQDLWGQSRGIQLSSSWSRGENDPSTDPSWLLLKNLTAQIDGSTLRTLCMKNGSVRNFHLYLTHGIAIVKYSTVQEAKQAQNVLNNYVHGNTTINAETTNEEKAENILSTLENQHGGSDPRSVAANGSTPAAPLSDDLEYCDCAPLLMI